MPQPIRGMDINGCVDSTLVLQYRPNHAMMIGMIAVEWARMEKNMALMFSLVTGEAIKYEGTPEENPPSIKRNTVAASTMRALDSLAARLNVLREAFEERFDKETLGKFEALATKIRRTAGARNRVVHGLWGIHQRKPDIIVLFEPDDKTFIAYTIPDLREILDRVVALGIEVYNFESELTDIVSAKLEWRPIQS